MVADDRVLIAYVPRSADFEHIRRQGWYHIPQAHAPKGLHAEYIAFYFGRDFADDKYAIHYFARNMGHELVRRCDLFPDQPGHPRANQLYYKLQIGPLQRRDQPILNLRWRRLLFAHTTWDRFRDAVEIGDLFVDGDGYVDRVFTTLRDGEEGYDDGA